MMWKCIFMCKNIFKKKENMYKVYFNYISRNKLCILKRKYILICIKKSFQVNWIKHVYKSVLNVLKNVRNIFCLTKMILKRKKKVYVI